MVMTVAKRHVERYAPEEGRRRVEDKPVLAGLELHRELHDPPVVVRLPTGDHLVARVHLDGYPRRRPSGVGVEYMRRERRSHALNLLA